jgi:hypothetical protein
MNDKQGPKRPTVPVEALRMYLFKSCKPDADDSHMTALFDAITELDEFRRGGQ